MRKWDTATFPVFKHTLSLNNFIIFNIKFILSLNSYLSSLGSSCVHRTFPFLNIYAKVLENQDVVFTLINAISIAQAIQTRGWLILLTM